MLISLNDLFGYHMFICLFLHTWVLQDIVSQLEDTYGHKTEKRESYMAVAEGIERCPVTGQVSAFADVRKLPGGASFVQKTIFI